MKIAQFIDTLGVGGAETMIVRLSHELHKKGHDVVLLHFGNEYIARECDRLGIQHERAPFYHQFKSMLTLPLFSLRFANWLKRKGFSMLHSHLYGPISGCYFGTFIRGIRHIGTLHDVYVVKERTGRGLSLRIAQMLGTRLVAVSEDMQRFYQSYIPASAPVQSIHNGFDAPMADASESNTSPAKERVTLITVGRLVPIKRIRQQIETLAPVLKNTGALYLIAGDGPEKKAIEASIVELGLSSQVQLLGERSDIITLLQQSDIFTLASASEGLSCSILEAISQGLPCVVSDVGGNRELVAHGKNGFLFEINNESNYQDYCQQLIEDEHLRQSFGKQSVLLSRAEFSLDAMANRYLELYQAMAN